MIATSPCGARKRKENLSGATSMTQAATVKIAAEAPSMPVPGGMNGRLKRNARMPPEKNTARYLTGPTFFSSVLPKTNRNSMLPKRCSGLGWTKRGGKSVHSRPCVRLVELKISARSAKVGGCCQAHALASMQERIKKEFARF